MEKSAETAHSNPAHSGQSPSNLAYDAQRETDYGRIIISCPDGPGIVAAVSNFLYRRNANIVASDQYSTHATAGTFFLRTEFYLENLAEQSEALCREFGEIAGKFSMTWRFSLSSEKKRLAIFVSKELHCLQELLWEWQIGELNADIRMIISNHEDARETAKYFGVPFHCIPVSKETKPEAESKQLALLENQVDLVVLARYMQILSPSFVSRYPGAIINIHHSFLPAFVGKNPYGRAHDRGVKLIGATAHYVTEELDMGQIIEQDVERVTHRDSASNLKAIGSHIERMVLSRAVKWHLSDRVLIYGNKTVVFS